ncbi:MAG TPA: zinc-ribbon domain-containing protein [Pyrinomonadaceae bacterium]|nr:zinc-ribbon domain-containing protein [Pyrinomonadaceae bacterium]
MYCPKCGSQNADETKFCRGCGADVSNALVPAGTGRGRRLSGRMEAAPMSIAEQQIELFSRGIRGLIMGGGLFVVSALAFILSERGLTFSLFMLAFGFLLVGTGISRLIHAQGLKALGKKDEPAELTSGQPNYIKPHGSIYDTDLLARPLSVTEHTTTHLEMDTDPLAMPKE